MACAADDEVLVAVLDPLDRTPQGAGGGDERDVLAAHRALAPNAPPMSWAGRVECAGSLAMSPARAPARCARRFGSRTKGTHRGPIGRHLGFRATVVGDVGLARGAPSAPAWRRASWRVRGSGRAGATSPAASARGLPVGEQRQRPLENVRALGAPLVGQRSPRASTRRRSRGSPSAGSHGGVARSVGVTMRSAAENSARRRRRSVSRRGQGRCPRPGPDRRAPRIERFVDGGDRRERIVLDLERRPRPRRARGRRRRLSPAGRRPAGPAPPRAGVQRVVEALEREQTHERVGHAS